MATAIQAREQLSRDIGDYFASTTTGNASDGSTLVDDALKDIEDDNILSPNAQVSILTIVAAEERNVASKVTDTLTMRRNFATTVLTSIAYEMHRQFSASEKDAAITEALDLIFPMVWTPVTADLTFVADQFDYDITASNFHNDTPHQVWKVSAGDSEITEKIMNWDIRYTTGGAARIHFFNRFNTNETIRLVGIKETSLADISGTNLLILSSRAAMYLYETAISAARFDSVATLERSLARHEKAFQERIIRFMRMAMPKTVRTHALRETRSDINFRVP